MNNFQRNIFNTVIDVAAPAAILEQGGVSSISQSTSGTGCNLIVDSVCYFDTAVNGSITSGDIAYNTNDQTSPILGGGQYYKVTIGIKRYVVLIGNNGLMNVDTICV